MRLLLIAILLTGCAHLQRTPEGGWRYVSWAFRDKESWLSYDGLSGREALGKWEVGDNE